jgi:hypothetical protein
LHHDIKPSINTLSQARFIHATMPRLLSDADRSRMQAYLDAMQTAMGEITEYDPDRVREACEAVAKAHPIDDALREAYEAEMNGGKTVSEGFEWMHDPLITEYHERVKPDAPWGMVVYRASYGDDAAWERMLAQLNESLEGYDSEESKGILARHQLVVMDDRQQFQGATTDQVREHFDKWTVDELRRNWREQPVPEEEFAKFVADDEMDHAGLRYNFCLLVDDLCLESLDKMPGRPVVKLVSKHWAPYAEDELDQLQCDLDDGPEEDIPRWEGGVSNSEGEDIGWKYMEVSDYVQKHNDLYDYQDWADEYVRPPFMDWDYNLETAPGFWQRSGTS